MRMRMNTFGEWHLVVNNLKSQGQNPIRDSALIREKVDHGSGERSARERACRRRNPLFLRVSYWSWISSLLPRISALSELWSASNSGVSVSWMEDAVVGVEGTVEATTALPPPVLVAERRKFLQLRRRRLKLLGGEGSFSLTSPALGSRCFMLVRMWDMCLVRERFSTIDLKGFEASPSDEISKER
ncbi:hypothetical protein YC2023_014721 [Brassica napus]